MEGVPRPRNEEEVLREFETSASRERKNATNRRLDLLLLQIAFGMFFLQQWAGQNSISYYAPTIFKSIGLKGTSVGLLASGIVRPALVSFPPLSCSSSIALPISLSSLLQYGIVKIVATSTL